MVFQTIIDFYNKVKGNPAKQNTSLIQIKRYGYTEFENAEYFNQVLDKCVTAHTDITGLAGTGKTNLMAILTNKLYKEKKSYLMCSNSINELNVHFQKHLIGENILIFCLKRDKSHTIDINYLFSLDSVWDFVCVSSEKKEIIKKNNYPTWFAFFNDESNAQLLKNDYFQQLKDFITTGHIDDYGDLNLNTCQKPLSAYFTLQEEAYYYNLTEEDKRKYIFFLNILQLSLSKDEIVNIIFDEEKVFFDGYKNGYIKSLFINGVKNNFIFCSHFLEDVFEDTQIICFKGKMHSNFRKSLVIDRQKIKLDISELYPGEFYFFNHQMKSLTNRPIKVPYIEENIKVQWELFMNNKQKKMHKQLQLDLPLNNTVKDKKFKI